MPTESGVFTLKETPCQVSKPEGIVDCGSCGVPRAYARGVLPR